MKRIITVLISIGLSMGMLSGCGSHDNTGGMVSTDGSTSMEKVIGYLSESYQEEHSDVKVTYNPTGSGSGIKAVSEGSCDIGLSSRNLNEEEKQKLTATVVAIDGIAIIVNPENKIGDLSIEQISSLFCGEITNWNELGGDDLPVVLIGREAASGTRDGFESITDTKDKCKYSQELTSTGDVVQTVASNPNAIGYASLAAIKENVKAVKVDGIYPSKEAIQNGSYKVQRDFVFVTRKNAEMTIAAKEFFEYAVSGEADALIEKSGAIPVARNGAVQ